ncbi:MAG TPA: flagellar protein [Acetivibrio sp.]|uniref:flagellar protein n=1 Tax=Acetivibrio sp. TaxID=1872092 RepID=UPI002B5E6800|nr:flagellar protein [Acetivibrio sp.]HOM03762.1 flagellar protein [Acetivibrio sp.]
MIDISTCEICGKLYNNPHGFFRVCPICYESDEYEFKKIKDYLNLHPSAKIFDVVTDLNISVKQIKRYLRESRLEILEKDNHFLLCESCGKSIRTGRYCDECYKSHHRNIKAGYSSSNSTKHSNAIRFRNDGHSKRASSI